MAERMTFYPINPGNYERAPRGEVYDLIEVSNKEVRDQVITAIRALSAARPNNRRMEAYATDHKMLMVEPPMSRKTAEEVAAHPLSQAAGIGAAAVRFESKLPRELIEPTELSMKLNYPHAV